MTTATSTFETLLDELDTASAALERALEALAQGTLSMADLNGIDFGRARAAALRVLVDGDARRYNRTSARRAS